MINHCTTLRHDVPYVFPLGLTGQHDRFHSIADACGQIQMLVSRSLCYFHAAKHSKVHTKATKPRLAEGLAPSGLATEFGVKCNFRHRARIFSALPKVDGWQKVLASHSLRACWDSWLGSIGHLEWEAECRIKSPHCDHCLNDTPFIPKMSSRFFAAA